MEKYDYTHTNCWILLRDIVCFNSNSSIHIYILASHSFLMSSKLSVEHIIELVIRCHKTFFFFKTKQTVNGISDILTILRLSRFPIWFSQKTYILTWCFQWHRQRSAYNPGKTSHFFGGKFWIGVKQINLLVGGVNPIWKISNQMGSSPNYRMKMQHTWTHHPVSLSSLFPHFDTVDSSVRK